MTPDERQALREKHQPQPHTEWFPLCATCNTQSPCDVIKVLDWAEQAYDDGWKACNDQWSEL
jgi:hypothetical protein